MWFPWVYPQEPDMALWWIGPGTHLYLCIKPFDPQGTQVRIEHPCANEEYNHLHEAQDAVRRFVKRCDPQEQADYLIDLQEQRREDLLEDRAGSAGMAGYDEALEADEERE